MKRRDMLKATGLASLAAVVPFVAKSNSTLMDAHSRAIQGGGGCVLIPTETAGPFPLDLTTNPFYFRQDVREGKPGVQMNLKLKILGLGNCLPMQNVRVNIWHCDKDGKYSGYSVSTNPGQAGLTYLRGYQIADANGEVEFITILPGWYPGRVCHIHFQVYVNSIYAAISQLTFPVAEKDEIFLANTDLYVNGIDPVLPTSDGAFVDGYNYQTTTLTPSDDVEGYDAFLEVTVQGEGTTGIPRIDLETGGQFVLGQNFPNPYRVQTSIPLNLISASRVRFDFYDLNGKKVQSMDKGLLTSGDHIIDVNLSSMGLLSANYVYQVEVENSKGIFRQYKLMTAAK